MIVDVDNDNAMIEDENRYKVVGRGWPRYAKNHFSYQAKHLKITLNIQTSKMGKMNKMLSLNLLVEIIWYFDHVWINFHPREEEFKVTEEQNNTNVQCQGGFTGIFEQFELFSAEPLVRDGVASTLALLKMRGINLTARVVPPNAQCCWHQIEYFDQFGNKLNSKEGTRNCRENSTERVQARAALKNETSQGRNDQNGKRRIIESIGNCSEFEEAAGGNGEAYMILSSTRQQSETKLLLRL